MRKKIALATTLFFFASTIPIHALSNLHAVVFAAGRSTRFGTGDSKLRTKINGKPLILYSVEALNMYAIPTTLVVNFQQEYIKKIITNTALKNITFVKQKKLKGTGAALAYSRIHWNVDHILAINGDMVLRDKTIIKKLYDTHLNSNADLTFASAYTPSEKIARVIVDEYGTRIVEIKHFTGNSQEYPYSNIGIYIFKRTFLEKHINEIEPNAQTHEYYVTSLIEIANNNGYKIATIEVPFDNVRGVNTQQELQAAQKVPKLKHTPA